MEAPTKPSSRGLSILPNINMNIRRAIGIGTSTPTNGTPTATTTATDAVSPITPSTPPVFCRKSTRDQNPRDRDSRLSIDSVSSTVYGEEGEEDEVVYVWSSDQVAAIVRTLEDGSPSSRWSPPTTPYVLPYLPDNLVDSWARELKRSTDWPHSVRSIRLKLRSVARTLAKEGKQDTFSRQQARSDADRRGDIFATFGGPVALAAGIGNINRVQELDEDSDQEDEIMMDYERSRAEEDNIIVSPVLDVPLLPAGQGRNDSNVYKSSMKFQRNDRVIGTYAQFHPYARDRPRSPIKSPRSPSLEPVSPTEGHFPSGLTRKGSRPRSRSVSPIFGPSSHSVNSTPSRSPSKLPLETPSLSPMKLSPSKAGETTIAPQKRDREKILRRSPDPADMLAAASSTGGPGKGRGPIPMPFFTRDMMRPNHQVSGNSDLFGSNSTNAGNGNLFSLHNPNLGTNLHHSSTAAQSDAASVASGATPYSTISSVSSLATTFTRTHPHLSSTFGGLKRSSSFSRPPDLLKRAPSYGNLDTIQPRKTLKDKPSSGSGIVAGIKRERSDSDHSGGYDSAENGQRSHTPSSSAPSSGLIPSLSPSPNKADHNALPYDLHGTPSPTRSHFLSTSSSHSSLGTHSNHSASPLKGSPSKLLASPPILSPERYASRKKASGGRLRHKGSRPRAEKAIGAQGSDSHDSLSPSPAPRSPSNPAAELSPTATLSPSMDWSPNNNEEVLRPPMTMSPSLSPRPALLELMLADNPGAFINTPKPPQTSHSRSRQPSAGPMPLAAGEPRRKRVKTDELATPPPQTRARTTTPSYTSPRTGRSTSPRSGAAKTPRAGGMRSPRTSARTRTRSGMTGGGMGSAAAAGSAGGVTSPASRKGPDTTRTRATSMHYSGARLSSPPPNNTNENILNDKTPTATTTVGKAKRPGLETIVSKSKPVKVKNAPKREPSFFGAELVLKSTRTSPSLAIPARSLSPPSKGDTEPRNNLRRVGTTRFPAATTASISSVLFPGGPPEVSAIGDEENMIRAGDSPALARKAGGLGRERVRARSRMTRSISMLGPGERLTGF